MTQNIILGLRSIQVLFAIIVLGLTAYAVNSSQGSSPDEVNFLLFDAIWTMLIAVPYLVLSPLYFPAVAHKYALIATEAITLLFWFAGFIALAASLPPAGLCKYYTICKALQAATVFSAFEWLLFVATAVLVVVLPLVRGRETHKPEAGVNMQAHAGV
ncbi:hypothetical protein PAAG_08101 [Paracoccidioides lutzii Pb01]|uniref:MARVEL domain-containing protein n=1 Tax=Paracoccidioides lutzii (strain ATCC MYA-826 / Pb01) TaxID=502779 RepID=C1HBG0_PARBA|nr:hypothetical protein PAAG_08101 [Paracoccidioides lutzii Pb01]EEH37683.1 hypothetical protein PAAG_08101 [Paracoccidioides lutzii Pb01]